MKTLIFLNLRFANFYSQNLFKRAKEVEPLRIVVIVDQQFKNRIPAHFIPDIDQLYFLSADEKNGFLAEFDINTLKPIIEKELSIASTLKIICSDEFNLLNAGQLRREYRLGGHTDLDLLPYRDKVVMKSILAKNNIRVPRFQLLYSLDNYTTLTQQLGVPFILKPKDSCGSHGVYKIHTEHDFQQLSNQKLFQRSNFEAEEFIQGKLYHVDSYMRDKEIQFICANEYTFPNHDYTQGNVLGSIPLAMDNILGQRLMEFAKKSLQAMDADNIVNHMELFVTHENEIIFLEVSARPPGAIINLTHQINFGINLMDEDFFLQSDIQPIRSHNPSSPEKAFWAFFPLIPGVVKTMQAPLVKSRMEINWFTKVHSTITKSECNNIVNKAAQAIFYHSDEAILREDFEYIKSHQALIMI